MGNSGSAINELDALRRQTARLPSQDTASGRASPHRGGLPFAVAAAIVLSNANYGNFCRRHALIMPTFAAVDIGSNSCRLKIARVVHGRLQTL
ncbi:MAG TPA: hypothetical protein VE779_14725, partial [Candidatus Angelobacter sp.]|nr:hypothetical protein [Candidatus Angelobacter sp.]